MIALSIVVATILLNVIMYPRLPDRIAIQWNIQGVADGYSSRLFGLIIIPFVSLFVYGLFTVLPRIDPNKAFQEFQGFYNGFMNMFLFYVLYFNVIFIARNMGLQANIGRLITPGIAAMFFSVGVLFEKSKQNWFVGSGLLGPRWARTCGTLHLRGEEFCSRYVGSSLGRCSLPGIHGLEHPDPNLIDYLLPILLLVRRVPEKRATFD